ncbi:MAG TPA: 5'/3'-nucleotidase SurE [Fimbriimonadaceae bacterium]|nr:5'/3'-nucleotidase SurE [Fimbriimonadaceae bacterium]
MRILITNDDGIRAAGLAVLARAAQHLGTVKIVAPDRERSACSHGMTLRDPLRVKPIDWDAITQAAPEAYGMETPSGSIEAYEVNGLPVDCVNVGLTVAWPDGCDLVLSGINHGPNLGFDVTYSGTVGGAMEGAINGVRSIAVSMAVFVDGAPLHFRTAARWLEERLETIATAPWEPLTFLNVNIPAIAYEELRGERVAVMGRRVYEDRLEERSDPWGRPYFWQGGVVAMSAADQPGTDVHAVSEGFVSLTPISLDWTAYALSDALERSMAAAPRHPTPNG